jgi:stage II sporulation protein AA (anti-sigma F factor antagonist)
MSLPPCPAVNVSLLDDMVVARFHVARLDGANTAAVAERLFACADEARPRQFRVDVGSVEYLSSAALTMLVRLHKQVVATGGRLAVVNLRPHVRDVFEATRLTTVFDVEVARPLSA